MLINGFASKVASNSEMPMANKYMLMISIALTEKFNDLDTPKIIGNTQEIKDIAPMNRIYFNFLADKIFDKVSVVHC